MRFRRAPGKSNRDSLHFPVMPRSASVSSKSNVFIQQPVVSSARDTVPRSFFPLLFFRLSLLLTIVHLPFLPSSTVCSPFLSCYFFFPLPLGVLHRPCLSLTTIAFCQPISYFTILYHSLCVMCLNRLIISPLSSCPLSLYLTHFPFFAVETVCRE